MFAGHVGAALAIGSVERRVNVSVFVAAAVLLDFVLWLLVLLGLESVTIPANFNNTHQPEFAFPYSHGLMSSLAWSALSGFATFCCFAHLNEARVRAAVLVAVAVFSHWLLDALVHAPELPIAGNSSAKVGLGLWDRMPMALTVEAVIAIAGLILFVSASKLPKARRLWLSVLLLVLLAFTVVGMTVAPPPPSVAAMAMSSLITIVVVCALAWWIGRIPSELRR